MSRGAIDTVLFDLFGTLIVFDTTRLPDAGPIGGRGRSTLPLLLPILAREAPTVDPLAFAGALQAVSARWAATRQAPWIERPSRERFRAALRAADCPPDALERAAIVLSRQHLRALANATVFPAAHAEALTRVAARRRIGIVTNFDDTSATYEILQRHGLLAVAAAVVVSDAIGLRKPNPLLVQTALGELDAEPARTLLVGDTYDEDVLGAHAAGVRAVWIDAHGRGVPAGSALPAHVVRSLPDVVPLV